MRQRYMTAVLMVFSLGGVAQEGSTKPTMSSTPLTTEQIAVYRAVLTDYLKGSNGALNLANVTEPIGESEKACLAGRDSAVIMESASVIHRIEPSVVANTKIVLVDPDRQQKTIKENDPQNLIKKAIDDHQKVTDEELDQSVKSAFDSGLFELSEVVFDKGHRRAVVSYSFVCGGLCGNGNTLLLKKAGENWKVAKRCGGWIS